MLRISVRATDGELAAIDQMRGTQSVSDYIRALVRSDANRRAAHLRKDTPTDD